MTHWPGKRTNPTFFNEFLLVLVLVAPEYPHGPAVGAETVGFFLNPTLPAS
jgi:hypothetical protein